MKSIEAIGALSQILKFFGWFSIAIGFLFFIHAIFTQTISLWLSLSSVQQVIGGLVFLSLAQGLSRKEKWSFYVGFVIFTLFLIQHIVEIFFFGISFVLIVATGINIFSLFLLIKGQQLFTEQPKEKVSQWLHKPHFIMVVVGVLISYLIMGGFLAYQYWWLPREETKASEEREVSEGIITEDETADLETYGNEQYGFELVLPDRWQDYKVNEEDGVIVFKLKHTIDEKYHAVLTITIYNKEEWEQFQSEEGPGGGTYIDEKGGYIFSYFIGHDDEGYVGFPEIVPGEIYQGPFYDVKNKIIPTFKFIEGEITPKQAVFEFYQCCL